MASFDANRYVKDFQTAWNAKDPEAFLQHFSETVEFQDPRATEPQRGKEKLRASIKEWFGAFGEMQIRVKESTVGPKNAAILYECKGRHTGEFAMTPTERIPATNKPATVDVAEFMTLDNDGKITRDITVLDSAKLMMQLGLLPSSEASARGPPTKSTVR